MVAVESFAQHNTVENQNHYKEIIELDNKYSNSSINQNRAPKNFTSAGDTAYIGGFTGFTTGFTIGKRHLLWVGRALWYTYRVRAVIAKPGVIS